MTIATDVSVIIPTFNERANLPLLVERITQAFGDKGEAETSSPPPLRAVP